MIKTKCTDGNVCIGTIWLISWWGPDSILNIAEEFWLTVQIDTRPDKSGSSSKTKKWISKAEIPHGESQHVRTFNL